jgi:transcriptional regulator with XRE-family HTH domain
MEDIHQGTPASPGTEHPEDGPPESPSTDAPPEFLGPGDLNVVARFLAYDPRDVFRRRLREMRIQRELTQADVAEMLQPLFPMHRSAIAKIESGDRPVLLGEAVALAWYFRVPLDEMLSDPEPTKRELREVERLMAQAKVHEVEREVAYWAKKADDARLLMENAQARLEGTRQGLAELAEENEQ